MGAFRESCLAANERLQMAQLWAHKKTRARRFFTWYEYVRANKQRLQERAQRRRCVLQRTMHQWQYAHALHTQRDRYERQALRHFQDHVIRTYFRAWQLEVSSARCRRELAQDRLVIIQRCRLQAAAFNDWRENVQAKMMSRFLRQRASGHFQNYLLLSMFEQWIEMVGQKRWGAILHHRAVVHNTRQRLSSALRLWQQRATEARRIRERTAVALLHWKAQMEGQAFRTWQEYVRRRVIKRSSRHEALEWRQRMFLQQGLLHWATAGFSLREQRILAAAREAAARAERVWRHVAQIASHWRHLVLRRRAASPAPARAVAQAVELRPMRWAAHRDDNESPPPVDLLYDQVPLPRGVAKYGIEYKITDPGSPAPLTAPKLSLQVAVAPIAGSMEREPVPCPEPEPAPVARNLTHSESVSVDAVAREMEVRLKYWQKKKAEWVQHKQHMQDIRRHLEDLREDSASIETVRVLERTLLVMEATHAEHQAAYIASKAEMAAFNEQIQRLSGQDLN
ncbi:hypothetical protein ACHHYP_01591 [Achlya hypogyna]|uniref:Sfi1 spindle body domain-containing protein n=1 Tax=Achlya hypogyna TaxID=1202772 RepID=A0A1V9Z897_ACHHY|nr:hypothetical protein ACHHYP_01591 [Achlya hypogyna]